MKLLLSVYLSLTLLICISCKDDRRGIVVVWENEEYLFAYTHKIESQEALGRELRNVDVQKVNAFFGLENSPVFQPVNIKAENSSIFILDGINGQIVESDYKGNFKKRIGEGLGRGPGQFEQPFDFCRDEEGDFYIVDLGLRSLTSLSKAGKFRWQKLFEENTPGNVFCGDSTIVVSVTGVATDAIFEVYGTDGSSLKSLKSFVTPVKNNLEKGVKVFGRPLLGNIEVLDKEFVYVPLYINQLIYFGEHGFVKKAVSTIDVKTNPKLLFGKDEARGLSGYFPSGFEGKKLNLRIAVMDKSLIIWSQVGNELFGHHIFDVYELTSGRYKYSFKLDLGAISGFGIKSNRLVTYNTATSEIVSYLINLPE